MQFKIDMKRVKEIKNKRKQFDQLWRIRMALADAGQSLHLGEIDDWQEALMQVDRALIMEHAKPFYDAGGNPPKGYAERFKGREDDVHIRCNDSGECSSITDCQLGAFIVLMQNTINTIHWANYYDRNLDKIWGVWSHTLKETDLI